MIWNVKSGRICTLKKIHIYSKKVNTSNVVYWDNWKYFKGLCCKKNPLYEISKM
jgi:hypothetical protein